MILKNAKIFNGTSLDDGIILIDSSKIKQVILKGYEFELEKIRSLNSDKIEINCEGRIVLPGIIDIHAHLRDMDQSEKETFSTGTKAAAYSGITTVFNMPNTKPPAITADQVKKWMKTAKNKIFIDVAFISGVPNDIDEEEIKKIINLGVKGLKIYPLKPINNNNWYDENQIQKLLLISSKYRIPIFIHPDYLQNEIERPNNDELHTTKSLLKIYDQIHPCKNETKYVTFILKNYFQIIEKYHLPKEEIPIIHFCHISCKSSIVDIQNIFDYNFRTNNYLCEFEPDISFEVTPHHLLLSSDIKLEKPSFGKVLPPLRNKENSSFIFEQLQEGNIEFIGTDHAPHTLEEKSLPFFDSPSGFPGFETFSLMLLDKVFKGKIDVKTFAKMTSENPAKRFKLELKGKIDEGYYADLIIVEKVKEYKIKSSDFRSKATYSPFENSNLKDCLTTAKIWKVFLRGNEINNETSQPSGIVIRNSFK